jgi:hypothetical protein
LRFCLSHEEPPAVVSSLDEPCLLLRRKPSCPPGCGGSGCRWACEERHHGEDTMAQKGFLAGGHSLR